MLSNISDRKSFGGGLFLPLSISDFDDGSSFPEIHVAQYPMNIGNPHLASRRKKMLESLSSQESKNKSKFRGGDKKSRNILGSSVNTTRDIVNVEFDSSGRKRLFFPYSQ